MRQSLHSALLRALLVAGLGISSFDLVAPATAQQTSYKLLENASASGPQIFALSGNYQLNISGTFGGATVALIETEVSGGATHTLGSWTSAPDPTCIVVPAGVQLQMTVTDGSPSGLYANLGGVGPGGCTGGSSGGDGVDPVGLKNASGTAINPATTDTDTNTGTLANAAATPGSDGTKAIAVQGVTSGKPVSTSEANSSTIATNTGNAATNTGTLANAAANPGSDGTKALAVQGVASGKPVGVGAASGAFAAGALASGAGADGWDATQGAKADSSCGTDSGTCSAIALVKRLNASITTLNGKIDTLNTTAAASNPGGSNDIGTVQPFAQPSNYISGTLTSAMTGTTDTQLIAAPGSGLNNYLQTIVCGNSHATVSTGINIKDGSGGTVIGWVPASAVYGGTAVNFFPALKQPTANTALYVADDVTGASVKCTATGFKR